jgi:hypothetical protein
MTKFYENKEYIEMCEKAEEIQSPHRFWQPGDILIRKSTPSKVCVVHGLPENGRYHIMQIDDVWSNYNWGENTFIFVPRQDQLQEMIKDKPLDELLEDFIDLLKDIAQPEYLIGYLLESDNRERINKKSLEQLWLMLVMEKLYSKTWNGEDWI